MLELSHWPYIQTVTFSGELKTDITTLLTENGKGETATHCIAVAKTSEKLAIRFGLDKSAASVSALLHDVSNVVRAQDMLDYAVNHNWELDASEKKYPFLLHQRLSAVFARDLFGINEPIILSAIGVHTTLKENPSAYDMILFLADKLSWDQDGTPPFFDAVSSALDKSLAHASLVYINFILDNGMILSPHRWLMSAKIWLENLD
jgi:putative HD superfamily hydrolase of NAD metabolism